MWHGPRQIAVRVSRHDDVPRLGKGAVPELRQHRDAALVAAVLVEEQEVPVLVEEHVVVRPSALSPM